MSMRIRFSLRHLLFAVTLFACCCAWFALNASRRRAEKDAIAALERIAETGIAIGDGKHPFGGCGNWYDGMIVRIDNVAPAPLSSLGLDCTKRVTSISTKCQNHVELFEIVKRFPYLNSLYVERRTPFSVDADGRFPPFTEALIQFRNAHPNISVVFWGNEE